MKLRTIPRKSLLATVSGLGAVCLTAGLAGPASADSVSGWTGGTPPNSDGIVFLHNSTIINAPNLRAESAIWTAFGQSVRPGYVGVRARLFKSGVLCQAIDYRYNTSVVTKWTYGTSADCGPGSYNSHGFVNYDDPANGRQEAITFPSNPLNYSPPAAQKVTTSATPVASGVNAHGKTFGSGDVTDAAKVPDLVAAYATNGKQGFLKKEDLEGPGAAKNPGDALKRQSQSTRRVVAVYGANGIDKVGEFVFS